MNSISFVNFGIFNTWSFLFPVILFLVLDILFINSNLYLGYRKKKHFKRFYVLITHKIMLNE